MVNGSDPGNPIDNLSQQHAKSDQQAQSQNQALYDQMTLGSTGKSVHHEQTTQEIAVAQVDKEKTWAELVRPVKPASEDTNSLERYRSLPEEQKKEKDGDNKGRNL